MLKRGHVSKELLIPAPPPPCVNFGPGVVCFSSHLYALDMS